MNTHVIAIRMEDRCNFAPKLQEVLTKYGCEIKVRLGVPDVCEPKGLILLVVQADEQTREKILPDLRGVPGTAVKAMSL